MSGDALRQKRISDVTRMVNHAPDMSSDKYKTGSRFDVAATRWLRAAVVTAILTALAGGMSGANALGADAGGWSLWGVVAGVLFAVPGIALGFNKRDGKRTRGFLGSLVA
jgi:hypothetical protein